MILNKISVISAKGFTLIEVMVATAVLSLGIVMVYEAFFISLDSFSYCNNFLNVASLADEKIWAAQDNLSRLGNSAQIENGGKFMSAAKDFEWNLTYVPVDEAPDLRTYKIDLVLSWQEGRRKAKLLRSAYAMYVEKK